MNINLVFAFCGCLLSFGAVAQVGQIEQVLREIEQNNKELQAYSSLKESSYLELKSENNLPDPKAGTYYLPAGKHGTGDYWEFEVTQSFEFPTVYSARRNMIDKQEEQMQLENRTLRQEVLLPAKKYLTELVYWNKKMSVVQMRVQEARQVFDQIQELFEKEEVGILEVNKAKISWMQEKFKVEQIETTQENLLLRLQNLNAGIEVSFDQSEFSEGLPLADFDSIWQDKQLSDPTLQILKQQEQVALQKIEVSKKQGLPDLTAGFNHQGIAGANYTGIFAGVSIPLWSNRHRVEAAKARHRYQQFNSDVKSTAAFSELQTQYNEYQILLNKFREYQSTLDGLDSETLLLEAYRLGEISFIEYYMELQFYRKAYDSMLEMENQLHQLKAEILVHQL